ncbi:dTDP-glucose 4,6-dehydratase [Paenibacillus rigui]|uniref:dTDP-glucose 4,6-dehydratase n=1 Tax=Paenibacillus rigui TaxID=554312 RepID=A0A229UY83_9BACL|nr:dTDP-glucose 4,6-dehydratase [Paenibacillus rigui]OXM88404.1 dTDP-glucose 4,6-dehydratase [Paenibacillus rigui]
MNVLITGGAGFIGSNFVKYLSNKYPHYRITNLDALTYAGNLENLKSIDTLPNYTFVKGNILDSSLVDQLCGQGIDIVLNFAAESHVDRSIEDPQLFIKTNVLGTQVLLDSAKKHNLRKFVQISTDEVYGSLGPTGLFTEKTPLAPNSPYSASKAGGDLLVRSYHETFGMNVNITRCSNNYGPYQFPEKLIPLMILRTLTDQPLPIYGDGLNVRDWLYVEDHCSAIDLVMHQGISGEVYNIGGNNEKTNLEIVRSILQELNKPESLINFVQDRPGHDRRYGIDATKIRTELGWKPKHHFEAGIQATIQWYLENRTWWERIQSGAYRQSTDLQVGDII